MFKLTSSFPLLVGAGLAAIAGAFLALYSINVVAAYTVSLFVLVPVTIGFLASAYIRYARGPQPLRTSFNAALVASGVLVCAFLVFAFEGLICIALAVPVAAPALYGGAALGYALLHKRDLQPGRSAATLFAATFAMLTLEPRIVPEPAVRAVADSVIVNASPAEVWDAVVALDEIPPPDDWIYRVGIACPQRTRIEAPRPGGRRVCTLSTGQLVEIIEVFEPERLLRWRTRSSPSPMRELNPWHEVDAPHLHGYYTSPRGEFALERLGPRTTRLTRRTWYSQRIAPDPYWRLFCELAISHIHRTVLDHTRLAAERHGVTTEIGAAGSSGSIAAITKRCPSPVTSYDCETVR